MNLPRATWRLIVHPPARGSWNMAVDEAMGREAGAGRVPPSVRLYAWDPPCVSLGRHQPVSEIDLEKCQAAGVDVVRRLTGGRAILHVDELTYSVAGPAEEPRLRGGVMDAYLRLSEALIEGLGSLGFPVQKADSRARAGADVSAACFEVPSAYEIMDTNGRKVVGSAQTRKREWVLQHGAVPLWGDVARLVDFLALDEERRERLRTALAARAVCISDGLGRTVTFAEVAEALVRGFERALNVTLVPGSLTTTEQALAQTLEREVYARPEWTAHV